MKTKILTLMIVAAQLLNAAAQITNVNAGSYLHDPNCDDARTAFLKLNANDNYLDSLCVKTNQVLMTTNVVTNVTAGTNAVVALATNADGSITVTMSATQPALGYSPQPATLSLTNVSNGDGTALTVSPLNILSNGTFISNGVLATNSGSSTAQGGFLTETGTNRQYSFNARSFTNLVAAPLAGGTNLVGTITGGTNVAIDVNIFVTTNSTIPYSSVNFSGITNEVWYSVTKARTPVVFALPTLNVIGITNQNSIPGYLMNGTFKDLNFFLDSTELSKTHFQVTAYFYATNSDTFTCYSILQGVTTNAVGQVVGTDVTNSVPIGTNIVAVTYPTLVLSSGMKALTYLTGTHMTAPTNNVYYLGIDVKSW